MDNTNMQIQNIVESLQGSDFFCGIQLAHDWGFIMINNVTQYRDISIGDQFKVSYFPNSSLLLPIKLSQDQVWILWVNEVSMIFTKT